MKFLVVVAVMAACLCLQASAFYPRRMSGSRGFPRGLPRCHSEAQPCRLRAELVGNDPLAPPSHQQHRVISRHVCACPSSRVCSSDWSHDNDHLLVRELRTNGNINMTFSMMFCHPVLRGGGGGRVPQPRCRRGDVALRLSGMSSLPSQVEDVPCTCADRRPLVLHRTFLGPDFKQYDDYVCANHKMRCNVHLHPTNCLEHNPVNQTDFYPCKCPQYTVCRSTSDIMFNKDFRCLPVNF